MRGLHAPLAPIQQGQLSTGGCDPQVLVLSFTTIIGLMVATFFVVLRAGGVHFNE